MSVCTQHIRAMHNNAAWLGPSKHNILDLTATHRKWTYARDHSTHHVAMRWPRGVGALPECMPSCRAFEVRRVGELIAASIVHHHIAHVRDRVLFMMRGLQQAIPSLHSSTRYAHMQRRATPTGGGGVCVCVCVCVCAHAFKMLNRFPRTGDNLCCAALPHLTRCHRAPHPNECATQSRQSRTPLHTVCESSETHEGKLWMHGGHCRALRVY
jgi:hypothetical protein